VLQRDGATALTVRHIADEAGVSTTGIYTHFGGKNGLVEAIFLEGFESFDQALTPAYEAGDLEAAGLAYRTWALDNRTHYLVMFGRAVPDFEAGEEAKARATASFLVLRDMVAAREVDDPDAAAYHLYAAVHGHVMLELVAMTPNNLHDHEALYRSGLARALAQLGSPLR
jgi:AcrR family transcriptional regulator